MRNPFAQVAKSIDAEWPGWKYLGFGFYLAWIMISYNSDVLLSGQTTAAGTPLQTVMHITSTFALAATLLLSALVPRLTARIAGSVTASLAAALVVVAGMVLLEVDAAGAGTLFYVGSVLTGVGTALVVQRFGMLHSFLKSSRVLGYAASSWLVAGLCYFCILSLENTMAVAIISALPLVAVLLTTTVSIRPSSAEAGDEKLQLFDAMGQQCVLAERPSPTAPVGALNKELPRGFFPQMVVAVLIFGFICGFYSGLGSQETAEVATPVMGDSRRGVLSIFYVVALMLVLVLGDCALGRRFNMSRLYYPIIVGTCFVVVILPLFGTDSSLQYTFMYVAYVLFSLFCWTLFVYLAHWSRLGFVRVFGFGRGASATGMAIGWACSLRYSEVVGENAGLIPAMSISMVFLLIVLSMLLLKEKNVSEVFGWSEAEEVERVVLAEPADELPFAPTGVLASAGESPQQRTPRTETWENVCADIAQTYFLTPRERDVLFLLGQRMTIERIADELCVSFNTAKSHVRRVYARMDIHSRKELFAYIDEVYGRQ